MIEIEQDLYLSKSTKGRKRKLEIIQAAIKCMAKDGIEKTTFESIAKTLSIQHSNVTYYFPDKADLIKASMKHISFFSRALIEKALQEVSNPEEKLFTYIESFFNLTKKYPQNCAVSILFLYYSSLNKEYQGFYHTMSEYQYLHLMTCLQELKSLKNASIEEIKNMAINIRDLLYGANIDLLIRKKSITHEEKFRSTVKAIYSLVYDYPARRKRI